MKRRKIIGVMLAVLLLLTPLTACQSKDTAEATEPPASADSASTTISDFYRFENYESDDVFDIETIELSDSLAMKCTSYKFTYLSDGYKIKAYISIPKVTGGSQKPIPCVMYNRGGNREIGMNDDSITANICAACGRVVVASQYRGADGSEGKDQFGGDDLHDVIRLIDLCETQFSFVDMEDFCAAGASRGGMMTYMAARQDSRIKRIIAVSALSDLLESYEARDDMKTVMEELIGGTPEEKPEEYKKRSAIFWCDEIKIPVLIIHSKQDKQVSFSQAQALYDKMKETTDCTLITHDDDSHGVLHADDALAIRQWLNQ